jgi:Skp family chaperone for outer membrane proteins
MKTVGFLTLLIMATLLFTLAFSAAAAEPKLPAAPVPAAAATPVAPTPAATPERHPHIEQALEDMRAARKELQSAEHDFQGHRVKSIEHLNQALDEAEICLKM